MSAHKRNWLYSLGDNLVGYDDGVDTPGERLGRNVNTLALSLWNDPAGTVGNALVGVKDDLDDLMFRGGAMRRPGDVFNYAVGIGAPQVAMRTLPKNTLGTFAGRRAKTADMDAPKRTNLTPAQQKAQEVLELIEQGRASEVTDDMMAAADDMYLAQNYDLPLDEASRMQRAREMGFDTDTPLYHGTRREFQGFDPSAPKSSDHGWYGDGVYLGDAELASEYAMGGPKDGQNVLPVVTRGRQMNWPEGNPPFMTHDDAAVGTRDMQALGYSGVDVRVPKGFSDAGDLHERLVFDPRDIRSRFARFDSRLSHLRNLSAGMGGVGVMSTLTPQEKDEIRRYLERQKTHRNRLSE